MDQKFTMSIRFFSVFAVTAVVLWGIAMPDSAFAQGCAMCRTALSGDDPATQGFNWSIGFLMVMPYVLFAAVAGWVVFMRRRHVSQTQAAS